VTVPSLNAGRNSLPMPNTADMVTTDRSSDPTRIGRGRRSVTRSSFASSHFSPRRTTGSRPCPRAALAGSRYDASTGVTVSDTPSEAASDTRYASPSGANIRPSSPDRANSGSTTRQTMRVA
jgi:hypothetical protein